MSSVSNNKTNSKSYVSDKNYEGFQQKLNQIPPIKFRKRLVHSGTTPQKRVPIDDYCQDIEDDLTSLSRVYDKNIHEDEEFVENVAVSVHEDHAKSLLPNNNMNSKANNSLKTKHNAAVIFPDGTVDNLALRKVITDFMHRDGESYILQQYAKQVDKRNLKQKQDTINKRSKRMPLMKTSVKNKNDPAYNEKETLFNIEKSEPLCFLCWCSQGSQIFPCGIHYNSENKLDLESDHLLMCSNWDWRVFQRKYRSEERVRLFFAQKASLVYEPSTKSFKTTLKHDHPIISCFIDAVRLKNFLIQARVKCKLWCKSIITDMKLKKTNKKADAFFTLKAISRNRKQLDSLYRKTSDISYPSLGFRIKSHNVAKLDEGFIISRKDKLYFVDKIQIPMKICVPYLTNSKSVSFVDKGLPISSRKHIRFRGNNQAAKELSVFSHHSFKQILTRLKLEAGLSEVTRTDIFAVKEELQHLLSLQPVVCNRRGQTQSKLSQIYETTSDKFARESAMKLSENNFYVLPKPVSVRSALKTRCPSQFYYLYLDRKDFIRPPLIQVNKDGTDNNYNYLQYDLPYYPRKNRAIYFQILSKSYDSGLKNRKQDFLGFDFNNFQASFIIKAKHLCLDVFSFTKITASYKAGNSFIQVSPFSITARSVKYQQVFINNLTDVSSISVSPSLASLRTSSVKSISYIPNQLFERKKFLTRTSFPTFKDYLIQLLKQDIRYSTCLQALTSCNTNRYGRLLAHTSMLSEKQVKSRATKNFQKRNPTNRTFRTTFIVKGGSARKTETQVVLDHNVEGLYREDYINKTTEYESTKLGIDPVKDHNVVKKVDVSKIDTATDASASVLNAQLDRQVNNTDAQVSKIMNSRIVNVLSQAIKGIKSSTSDDSSEMLKLGIGLGLGLGLSEPMKAIEQAPKKSQIKQVEALVTPRQETQNETKQNSGLSTSEDEAPQSKLENNISAPKSLLKLVPYTTTLSKTRSFFALKRLVPSLRLTSVSSATGVHYLDILFTAAVVETSNSKTPPLSKLKNGFYDWCKATDRVVVMLEDMTYVEKLHASEDNLNGFANSVNNGGTGMQSYTIETLENTYKRDLEHIFRLARHDKVAELQDFFENYNKKVSNLFEENRKKIEQLVHIDSKDENGNSILLIGCQNNYKKLVKLCFRLGASVNIQNNLGNTCLHYSFQYKFKDIFDYLLRKKADDSILNFEGLTCYEGLRLEDLD